MTPDTADTHETAGDSPSEPTQAAVDTPAAVTPDAAAAPDSAAPAAPVASAGATPWYQTTGAKIALAAGGVLLIAAFSFGAGVRVGARSSMAGFGPRAAMSMQEGRGGAGMDRAQPGPGMQRSPGEGTQRMPGAGQRTSPREGTGQAEELEERGPRLPEGHPDLENAPQEDGSEDTEG